MGSQKEKKDELDHQKIPDEQELDELDRDENLLNEFGMYNLADFKLPDDFSENEFLERFNHANFRLPNQPPKGKSKIFSILTGAIAAAYMFLYLCSQSQTVYGGSYTIIKETEQETIYAKVSSESKETGYEEVIPIFETATLQDLMERKRDNLFLPVGMIDGKGEYEIEIFKAGARYEYIRIVYKENFEDSITLRIRNTSGFVSTITEDSMLFYSDDCVFADARFYVYKDDCTADAVFTAGDRLYYITSNKSLQELIEFINDMEMIDE